MSPPVIKSETGTEGLWARDVGALTVGGKWKRGGEPTACSEKCTIEVGMILETGSESVDTEVA